jgi:hypothetical protein
MLRVLFFRPAPPGPFKTRVDVLDASFPSGRYPNSGDVLKRIRALSARLGLFSLPVSSCLILSRVMACQSNILAASDNYFKFKVSPKRRIVDSFEQCLCSRNPQNN